MLANPNRRRAASLTIELLLLTPVLLTLVVAAVELSLLLAAHQKVEAASAVGARVAAQGGTREEVEKACAEALGRGRIAHAEVRCQLDGEDGLPLPHGSPIECTISVNATEVVPDLLAFIGISLKNTQISGRTLHRKE